MARTKRDNLPVQVVACSYYGYNGKMGKTVQIDDDVMRAAERLAAERGVSPGEVISEAARKALTGQVTPEETGPAGAVFRNGWWVLPHRGDPPMSAEAIERLIEETELEDARRGGGA
ncbi:MAG: CopG family transcriptional regulator [Pseudolabrys sp.]|nr:CopG family transcriptional regulator [Pseudolabrys sp.]